MANVAILHDFSSYFSIRKGDNLQTKTIFLLIFALFI